MERLKCIHFLGASNALDVTNLQNIPGFMHRRIWQSMEIWENSGLPIPMVPCLH